MNKTVTINISGIIFHIEEDAYEKLGNYLNAVRNKFTVEDGRDEIMADIEARIAEILQQKTGTYKQVVLLADVNEVIAVMGEPEVISDNEEKAEEQTAKTEPANENPSQRRRLYRDGDDKIVGGVCSGLGYYFDVDRVFIRIGFAVLFFLFGTGILFYLLLMIIIPKAETTAEKLEMRGEPVDVNNISRSIKEEFEDFKKKAETFGKETKRRGRKFRDDSRDWYKTHPAKGIDRFFRGVLRFFWRVFAFVLIFSGVLLLVGIVTSSFAWKDLAPGIVSNTIYDLFPDGFHYGLAITAFFIVLGVPVLMMIYKGIRMLIAKKFQDRYIGIIALGIWVIGIILAGISIHTVSKAFSNERTVETKMPVSNFGGDTIYLKLRVDHEMENEDYYSHLNQQFRYARRFKAVSFNGDVLKLGYPHLRIVPSENDSLSLVVYKSANGNNDEQAYQRANAIHYNVVQHDSLFVFDSYFTLGPEQFWRCQDVVIELRVPKNKVVFIHSYLCDLLSEAINTKNVVPENMVDRRWRMTDKGLECIDCAGLQLPENEKLSLPDSLAVPNKPDSIHKK